MSYEEGWLTKRSRWMKAWRRRYAYLYDTMMYVAKTREAVPHFTFDLFTLDSVKIADDATGKKYSFEMIFQNGDKFFFSANSESDRKNWIEKIENVKKNPPRRVSGKELQGKTFMVSPEDEEFYMITKDLNSGAELERQRVDVASLNMYQRSFLRRRENRGLPFDITEYNPTYSVVIVHLLDGTSLKVCSDGVLGSTDPKKAKTIRKPSFIETD
jgi:hypothetical protein